ncbi:DUF4352 domain-containing protein [Paenibacillus sp. CAU 1782]
MKKFMLLNVVLLVALVLTACGGTEKNEGAGNKNNTANSSVVQEESGETPSEEPAEQPTEEPVVEEVKEQSYAVGDTFALGDWEVVLDSFTFDQKVKDQYFSSSADEGNKFIVLNYTVKNNGKQAAEFTSMFGGVSMKALFQGEYEYSYTITMIDGDLSDSIKPLSSLTGFVVIEVPDVVAESPDSLVINLDQDGDKAQITLR